MSIRTDNDNSVIWQPPRAFDEYKIPCAVCGEKYTEVVECIDCRQLVCESCADNHPEVYLCGMCAEQREKAVHAQKDK